MAQSREHYANFALGDAMWPEMLPNSILALKNALQWLCGLPRAAQRHLSVASPKPFWRLMRREEEKEEEEEEQEEEKGEEAEEEDKEEDE